MTSRDGVSGEMVGFGWEEVAGGVRGDEVAGEEAAAAAAASTSVAMAEA